MGTDATERGVVEMPEGSEVEDAFAQLSRPVQLESGATTYSQPRFLQGVVEFRGQGLYQPLPLAATLSYDVPARRRAQLIYFRAGNSSDALIYLLLTRDGEPLRYFPVGAQGAVHIPLAVVEDLLPGAHLELQCAASEGVEGTVVVDLGLLET